MSNQKNVLASCLFDAIDDINFSNVIVLLEKHGADPNTIIPKLQIAPIHYICGFDNLEFAEKVAKYFLQKKANPNLTSEGDGFTPLHIACIWGRSTIVRLLLDNGADLELKCSEGKTPITYAIAENEYQVIEVIQNFVFEQKMGQKRKELILKSRNQDICSLAVTNLDDSLSTPMKNLHLKNALQHLEEKKFTPNRINYNFDATSPYFINITHRRFKKSHESNLESNDDEIDDRCESDGTCSQKNIFELTEENLREFSEKMSQVIVIDRLAIHKRRSYIQNWQEKIQQIRKSDPNMNISYRRYLSSCNESSSDSFATAKSGKETDNSRSSVSTKVTLPPLDYDTDALRNELTRLGGGIKPGPITNDSTKRLYLKQLVKLKKYPELVQDKKVQSSYSMELQRTIDNFDTFEQNLSDFWKLETLMVNHFLERAHIRWTREENLKTSFIYLLIDPRISDNLPNHKDMDKRDVWAKFLSSIFYVGKGKRSRPYSHLFDAIKLYSLENSALAERLKSRKNQVAKGKQNTPQDNKKLNKIVDIWKSQMGIVCLHVFNNIMPCEAFSREAAIIEAIGIEGLTNMIKGQYYGAAKNFSMRQKRQLGIGLLYRACSVYLAEGESQLLPFDLI